MYANVVQQQPVYFITSVLKGILIKIHYWFMCLFFHYFLRANVTRNHSVEVTDLDRWNNTENYEIFSFFPELKL